MGVKRADKRIMDGMTMEVGVKESFRNKLVTNRLTWAGHVESIGDEKLAESRCLEGGGGTKARKTEIVMGLH